MKEHGIKADYRQAKRKRDKERQNYQAENILNRQAKKQLSELEQLKAVNHGKWRKNT